MSAKNISPEVKSILKAFQKNEITEHFIYQNLAKCEKIEGNRKVLEQIAIDEKSHYDFFKIYTQEDVLPNTFKIFWYYWIARILGITFGIKLMEKGEGNAQINYATVLADIPNVQRIMDDEDAHEQKLIGLLEEERLKYVGSIVLGLNDALVELTGALAGFSFAFQNTRLIALAGLITGIAASFSMAASEYLSQKHEGEEHPLRSSIYTGMAYVITVVLLILPYILFDNYLVCLGATLSIAIVIIFFFNYYISVAKDLVFHKRFFEMAAISLGVSAITFGIGVLVRHFIGINL